MAEWFRALVLPLAGFVLGRPIFKSSVTLCIYPASLPPASWDF